MRAILIHNQSQCENEFKSAAVSKDVASLLGPEVRLIVIALHSENTNSDLLCFDFSLQWHRQLVQDRKSKKACG